MGLASGGRASLSRQGYRVTGCKVYAMVTELAGRARYVKFGMATDHLARLHGVQTGCPLRIETLLYVQCPTDMSAAGLEAALHVEHADANCSGEWFRWDAGSKAEPEAREALAMLAQREIGPLKVVRVAVPHQRKRTAHQLTRYRNIAGKPDATSPVVGDADLSAIPVAIRRRKPLCGGG